MGVNTTGGEMTVAIIAGAAALLVALVGAWVRFGKFRAEAKKAEAEARKLALEIRALEQQAASRSSDPCGSGSSVDGDRPTDSDAAAPPSERVLALDSVRVTIDSPRERERVPHRVPMKGTVTGVGAGIELWIVKQPNVGQENYHPDNGPVMVRHGTWTGTACIGNSTPGADEDQHFLVHIVAGPATMGNAFREYLKEAHWSGSWPGLDSLKDGRILESIDLIRYDKAGSA